MINDVYRAPCVARQLLPSVQRSLHSNSGTPLVLPALMCQSAALVPPAMLATEDANACALVSGRLLW